MSKFFNPITRTLHDIRSYAGAVKFSSQYSAQLIKIPDSVSADPELIIIPKLRRGHGENKLSHSLFFSSEDHLLHSGSLDKNHISNADLVDVAAIIEYR